MAFAFSSEWFPLVVRAYQHLVFISIVLGIVFTGIGWFHAFDGNRTDPVNVSQMVYLRLFGPIVDPVVEAWAHAAAFHTAGSLMGRLFLDSVFAGIPMAERAIFGLSLGLLMFWSLRGPYFQFIETFLQRGVEAVEAKSPN